MELFAPIMNDDGTFAVNSDGTLACRPLTPQEQSDLVDAMQDAADEADAALDAAQAADPVQRELDDAAADLAYEYSGPEYADYDWGEPESWDDGG